jgi:mannose-6-phosphate isomerase-like protein (cupin superfamily)
MDTRRRLAAEADAIAVDGLEVRLLAAGVNGTMAHFRLAPGQRGDAVLHDELEELWYCVAGRGWLWMSDTDDRDVAPVRIDAGTSFSVPAGAAFQVANDGDVDLDVVAVTMPPWPGDHAVRRVEPFRVDPPV